MPASLNALSGIDEYYNLGSFGRKITTGSAEAQTWFNRGLTWAYGFNYEESARCFERAASFDPSCAMVYWGLAYASGPHYNKPWQTYDKVDLKATVERTYHASRRAKAYRDNATPVEQALIDAIQFRYPSETVADVEQYAKQNRTYADAMESVYRDFGDDLDVAAIYADSLMNLTPWNLWDITTGQPVAGSRTLDIRKVIEDALAREGGLEHPGLLHLHIHEVEMSPTPEIGLNAADRLRGLIPDAGHLNHMPSHLDVLMGDYRRSISSNYNATLADDKFLHRSGAHNFYTLYRLHNYHSLIYAAMFAGRKKLALDSVGRMEATIPQEILRVQSPPMADWLEAFLTVRAHVMVRFGMWDDIIRMALPHDQELCSVTTATVHYAKGVALAATGNVAGAERERGLFQKAFERVPSTRMDFPNKCTNILAVAAAMLDGEIEYRRGNYQQAFDSLRKSIELDDRLIYSEPWGWMQPARHAYAALMLEQGHVEEAAKAYSADLGIDNTLARARQHPNNVWALQGYHECMVRLGRKTEADLIEPQLRLALALADIPVKSSCFCRKDTSRAPGCCSSKETANL